MFNRQKISKTLVVHELTFLSVAQLMTGVMNSRLPASVTVQVVVETGGTEKKIQIDSLNKPCTNVNVININC